MTTTKPTDAVRERQTVFAGRSRADEFSRPSALTCWYVSARVRPWFSVASLMPIHGIPPSQYSGCLRLGVCPLSSWATLLSDVHDQPGGGVRLGHPTDRAIRPGITPVVASRPPVRPVPSSSSLSTIPQPLLVSIDGLSQLRGFGESDHAMLFAKVTEVLKATLAALDMPPGDPMWHPGCASWSHVCGQ